VVNRKRLDAAAPLEYFQFEILDIPKTKSCAFYDVNFVVESFRSSIRKCRVPQLMSVLLTEFMSAFDKFTVSVEIDFVVVD
jgi:hypothetical protein